MGTTWGVLAAQMHVEDQPGDTGLVARRYGHPQWPQRPVVQVMTEESVAAEDARQAALGFLPEGEPERVGAVPRPTLGFPEWPLLNDPAHAVHAAARMHDLDRVSRLAASRPKDAVALAEKAAAELDATVPHFVPTFLEEAARSLIRHDRLAGARSLFARARRVERTHHLPVDEDRHRAVFLEFSAADALPAKELSEEAKRLARTRPPEEAYQALLGLGTARTEAGGAPTADLPKDIARIGRAAGRSAAQAQRELLEALLPLPATADAPIGFWEGVAATVREWGRDEPAVLDRLLALPRTDLALDEWLEVLVEMGAADRLADGAPVDVVEEWLRRTLAVEVHPRRGFRRRRAEDTGGRLREMLARLRFPAGHELPGDIVVGGAAADIVDALLGAGAVVDRVAPGRHWRRAWLPVEGPGRDTVADLPHIAALPVHHPVRRAVLADVDRRLTITDVDVEHGGTARLEDRRAAMDRLAGAPGNDALLRQWVREWRASEAAGAAPEEMRAHVDRAEQLAGEGPEVLPWPSGTADAPGAEDSPAPAEASPAAAGPVTAPDGAAETRTDDAEPAPAVRPGWWAPSPDVIPLPEWLVAEFDARTDRYDYGGPFVLATPSLGASAPHAPVSIALAAAAHLPWAAQEERRRVAQAMEDLAAELAHGPQGDDAEERAFPEWTPEMRLPQARAMLGLPSRAKEPDVDHTDGPWTFTSGEYDEQLTFAPARAKDWALERERVDRIQGTPVEKDALATILLCAGELDPILAELRSPRTGPFPHPDASPADPAVSAPETVAAAATAHGLPEDAARYWLQLLALPGPKNTVVQKINGWTPARRKKAAAPLLEAGLVVQGRRPRAGRDLFLPGGWLEGKGPTLPMESWKRPMFLLHDTPRVSPRLGHVVHTRPMSEVYRSVWERVSGGDLPALQEPTTGGAR